MKTKLTALLLSLCMITSTTLISVSANNQAAFSPQSAQFVLENPKSAIDITHISPNDRDAYVESYVRAYIEANQESPMARNDRYYTYSTEESYESGTVSGYADNQYPNGYVLKGDGTDGLFWLDSPDTTEHSGSVTFTFPYKSVEITVTLGSAHTSSEDATGIFMLATEGAGNYKVWVTKTVRVRRVLIYQTDTRNGETTLWDEMYFQEVMDAGAILDKL